MGRTRGRALSADELRAQIHDALEAAVEASGGTQELLAQRLGVDPSTVSRWKRDGLTHKGARKLDAGGFKVGRDSFSQTVQRLAETEAGESRYPTVGAAAPELAGSSLARIRVAGTWFQIIPGHEARPYESVDRVEVTQLNDVEVSGRIRRQSPPAESMFEWLFAGQVREERFLFLTFWSISEENPSSNGVIALGRAGPRLENFEGMYIRHRFELETGAKLMPRPLRWTRKDPATHADAPAIVLEA